MKLATFRGPHGAPRPAAARPDGLWIDLLATDPGLPISVKAILAGGASAQTAAARAAASPAAVALTAPEWLAPIPDPGKLICVGLNYRDHALESRAMIPDEPVIFNKAVSALVGPGADIVLPKASAEVDFEGELVLVIGRRCRHLRAEDALAAVAGYTVGHDVSARDWQNKKNAKQWFLGKSFDTFAPVGPHIVTADEIADPHALDIRTTVNGVALQDSNTREFLFRIPQLLAWITTVMTLEPGDLVFTGTPAGVGFARQPPVFLQPGDLVEIAIAQVGTLRNRCVAEA
jgi:2-keto-4-pentenoate hydratase/2-oxohepta-3-ene-1,7-dioic acid hydratase in catechol pathway